LGEDLAKEKGVHPFKHVYFTGMVRDNMGRKMSKSLGNSPDSLALIKKYGADGVRYGILSAAAAGGDVIFDAPFVDKTKTAIQNKSDLCNTGSKFSNKLWNALRMIKGLEVIEKPANERIANVNAFAIKWLENEYNKTLDSVEKSFESLRLSEAVKTLYNFVWGDFCSWYLEMIKPDYLQPIDRATLDTTIDFFEKIMTLLHPFMPFITEEIWAHLRENRAEGDDCTVSTWPTAEAFDEQFLYKTSILKDLVGSIRNARDKGQLPKKELLGLFVKDTEAAHTFLAENGLKETIEKIAFLKSFDYTNEDQHEGAAFISGTEQYYLLFEQKIDVEAERKKLQAELKQKQGFVMGIEKKLSNERFVNGAPAKVIEMERKKLADGKAKVQLLIDSLDKLN
jgi:valyl-tRNA synthetase